MAERSGAELRRVLWRGEPVTARDLATATGLSIATCSAALNDMALVGEVVPCGKRSGGSGRSARLYRACDSYRPVLTVTCDHDGETRVVSTAVVSVTGVTLARDVRRLPRVGGELLVDLVADTVSRFGSVEQVVVGVPGIVRRGVVSHCDLGELDGFSLVESVRSRVGLPCVAGNDMHLMAYGLYRELAQDDLVVTLANFPVGYLPGTVTVYRGTPVTGAHHFAGMVGFAPLGAIGALERPTAALFSPPGEEVVARSLATVATTLDPDLILCTGSLVDGMDLGRVAGMLGEWIPGEFLPRLEYRRSLDDCYLRGMLDRALDERLAASRWASDGGGGSR